MSCHAEVLYISTEFCMVCVQRTNLNILRRLQNAPLITLKSHNLLGGHAPRPPIQLCGLVAATCLGNSNTIFNLFVHVLMRYVLKSWRTTLEINAQSRRPQNPAKGLHEKLLPSPVLTQNTEYHCHIASH